MSTYQVEVMRDGAWRPGMIVSMAQCHFRQFLYHRSSGSQAYPSRIRRYYGDKPAQYTFNGRLAAVE